MEKGFLFKNTAIPSPFHIKLGDVLLGLDCLPWDPKSKDSRPIKAVITSK